jgi:hypothetical protein
MDARVPVVLFCYARTDHLARVLECLRAERVPQLIAYSDGAKGGGDQERVKAVRALLRRIDWCELEIVERPGNWGLGKNILAGVTEVAAKHDAFIAWEDDLLCATGTYPWLCAALRAYASEPRVMSVTAWNHPSVTPRDVGGAPYFDGRAECWVWATWARAWRGMSDEPARVKVAAAEAAGVSAGAYGADLPVMANVEDASNIWAVRWLYHHMQHRGLCLRPPWSMIEHIGVDALATNARSSVRWVDGPLRPAPVIPGQWPRVIEHPRCRRLWRQAYPTPLGARWQKIKSLVLPRVRPTGVS